MREMKDSGIQWAGLIPNDWSEVRLRDYYVIEKGKNAQKYTVEYIGKNEGNIPVYSGQTDNDGVMGYVNDCDYDVESCLFSTTVGAKAMSPKLLRGKFCLSQNCLIMKSIKEIDNSFMFYELNPLFDFERHSIPQYMQPSLRIDDLNKFIVLLPSLEEQHRISAYLDAKCAEIDALTVDIQSQIDTLEQYKRSVITEAVTKGLDKDVEMKDSGSQYWGEIPATWDIVDIKYLFEIVKRIAGREGYDILSITQHGIKVRDTSTNEGQVAADYSNYQFLYPGEFAMNHMDLLTGWVDLSDKFGVTSPDYRVFRLRDTKRNSRRYYKYIMQICYMCRIFYSLGNGVSNLGRWRLQTSSFNNFKVPVPSYEEQKAIADYLDAHIGGIEEAIELKNEQLSTLDNFKKSLIFEYVTGKKEAPAV